MTQRATPSVFGIGLSKTGTHSLTLAVETLGFRAIHYPDPALMIAGRFDEALAGHDAATDISVAACFEELDRAYPGAKFILTHREIASWLDSVEDHYTNRGEEKRRGQGAKGAVRERVYGVRVFDRERFRRAYAEHTQRVRRYFAGRPDDLLEIDICDGAGWAPLCAFLGKPAPESPMPWANQRPARGRSPAPAS